MREKIQRNQGMKGAYLMVLAVAMFLLGVSVSYVAMRLSWPGVSTATTSLSVTTKERTETLTVTEIETTTELLFPSKWIVYVTIQNFSCPFPAVWRMDNKTMGVRLIIFSDAPYKYPDRWATVRIEGPAVNVTISNEELKQLGFDITKTEPETAAIIETTISGVSPVVGEKYHLEIIYEREDGSVNYALTSITSQPGYGGDLYPPEWMNFVMMDGDPHALGTESNWGGPDP